MSVLNIRVARTTHVFSSKPVAFVVVQGDEDPGDKTQQVSVGVTTPTRKRVMAGIWSPRMHFLIFKASLPSVNDEKCSGAFCLSQSMFEIRLHYNISSLKAFLLWMTFSLSFYINTLFIGHLTMLMYTPERVVEVSSHIVIQKGH